MAEYESQTGKIKITTIESQNYINWKDGELIFVDTPMAEVIKRLERRFNIEIKVGNPKVYKSVFNANFKNESLKEILDYISQSSQNICGRFAPDQLNKEIKAIENKKRFSWAYVWNVLLATFLFTESYGQGKPAIKKIPITKNNPVIKNKPVVLPEDLLPRMGTIAVVEPDQLELPVPREISGTVLDSASNKPLQGASVFVIGAGRGMSTDSLGNFNLRVNTGDSVIISYIGYNTQTLVVDNNTNWPQVKSFIHPSSFLLHPYFPCPFLSKNLPVPRMNLTALRA
jgi:co-chaperonin GroES (HSP10)